MGLARIVCGDLINVAVDAKLLPPETDVRDFVASNAPMAAKLIEEHGEAAVRDRWRQMVDGMFAGRLAIVKVTLAHLDTLWVSLESFSRRRNGNVKAIGSARDAAKTAVKDDNFISGLRTAVKRGSARDAAKTEPT